MKKIVLPRLDKDETLRKLFLPYCRFESGEIWIDKKNGHKIACIDSSDFSSVKKMMQQKKATLAVHDPPYNLVAFREDRVEDFIDWCKLWILNTEKFLDENSSLYIWLGADQKNHFQPFAEFIIMMKEFSFESRSFITMRNQRGYGTQKNWMAIRQELLYYTKGNPVFNVNAEYTDIPKVLKGYYKKVNGKITENIERSKSEFIRSGNVWIDIQQVFYRMDENINGCYAQKPLKSIERIILASSNKNDLVIDFFAHAGTTLIACEKNERKCYTSEIDPVYCEISLRRLERFRETGKTGWQNSNPFEKEILTNKKIRNHLKDFYGIEIQKEKNLL